MSECTLTLFSIFSILFTTSIFWSSSLNCLLKNIDVSSITLLVLLESDVPEFVSVKYEVKTNNTWSTALFVNTDSSIYGRTVTPLNEFSVF